MQHLAPHILARAIAPPAPNEAPRNKIPSTRSPAMYPGSPAQRIFPRARRVRRRFGRRVHLQLELPSHCCGPWPLHGRRQGQMVTNGPTMCAPGPARCGRRRRRGCCLGDAAKRGGPATRSVTPWHAGPMGDHPARLQLKTPRFRHHASPGKGAKRPGRRRPATSSTSLHGNPRQHNCRPPRFERPHRGVICRSGSPPQVPASTASDRPTRIRRAPCRRSASPIRRTSTRANLANSRLSTTSFASTARSAPHCWSGCQARNHADSFRPQGSWQSPTCGPSRMQRLRHHTPSRRRPCVPAVQP
mmetsp:Transcript_15794/g.43171  ORF Transcript_15794/g.43171 Transcript_15794/m.43171 type:complete len:302 (+) Transcript_15794:321-1226(+)